MEHEQVHVGQRVRMNMPGAGDNGQLGTVKQLRENRCYVHLDWDTQPSHVILVYADYLDTMPDESGTPSKA